LSGPWYRTAFGSWYPLLYAHRDLAEAGRCLDLLLRLVPLPPEGPLLDLGCGAGRHLRLLAGWGYPVVGLDLSPDLLAVARAHPDPVAPVLVRGDMRRLPLADRSLAGVLSLFTAFGYFGALRDNLPVIREVARVLRPGGHWFLDYVDCDDVRRELAAGPAPVRHRRLGPLSVREDRRLADSGRRVEKEVHLVPLSGRQEEAARLGVPDTGVAYTESVALFHRPEMWEAAAAAGLALVAEAGSYQGAPPGEGGRWIMVFRRDEEPSI